MNKRTVISELNKIANELDYSGKHTEADAIANVMKSLSQTKPLNMENGEAVMGKGEFYPLDISMSEEAKLRNRRIEIVISPNLSKLHEILDK